MDHPMWVIEYWDADAKAPLDCHPDFFFTRETAMLAATESMLDYPWATRWTLRRYDTLDDECGTEETQD